LHHPHRTTSNTKEGMPGYLRSIVNFFAPKFVSPEQESLVERILNKEVIETVNDCGEKRYIEMEREAHIERRKNLDILLSKCKRLLSFVELTRNERMYTKIQSFIVRVRQALYKGDDIVPLFDEFEKIKDYTKRGSKTFSNLSDAERFIY